MTLVETACLLCGKPELVVVPGFETLARVASDCRPWPPGGVLAVCGGCGLIQKPAIPAWRAEARAIYDSYAIYHQGKGREQKVFTPDVGKSAPRSRELMTKVFEALPLPGEGRLLDVGCGNGSLLRSVHGIAPAWRLSGTEYDHRCRETVEALPGVEHFGTGPLRSMTQIFDLVTVVHVLEHMDEPIPFLAEAAARLEAGGHLVIEVPDVEENPFELLVADHATHFTLHHLRSMVTRAGYSVTLERTDWIPKELSMIASVSGAKAAPGGVEPYLDRGLAHRHVRWLHDLVDFARNLGRQGPLGVFGTSVAATWLFASLGGEIAFFVDEDPDRTGCTFMDRPILAPADVPAGSPILMCLPTRIATIVSRRLERSGVGFRCVVFAPEVG